MNTSTLTHIELKGNKGQFVAVGRIAAVVWNNQKPLFFKIFFLLEATFFQAAVLISHAVSQEAVHDPVMNF